MKVLLTGGAGFIGSHIAVELCKAGHSAVIVDNLCNSKPESLRRVLRIVRDETGLDVQLPFVRADVADAEAMNRIFDEYQFDAVIHLAGLKAVGESVSKPLEYYRNNLGSTFTLADSMRLHGCRNLIFSSSATVYGNPAFVPITEDCPKGECTNPYGRTKSMIEEILKDVCKSDSGWNVVLLRYFNPVGAHPSGLIGENPVGVPNNLMPFITQTAVGMRSELGIFGNDYDTPDGTGVRDYIHVVDLARAHVAALKAVSGGKGLSVYNIGTGHGVSVLEMHHTFERVNGVKVPYSIKPRREGDIATCYCDPSKALAELGWSASLDLDDMCRDSWHFQQMNPDGYPD